MSTYLLQNQKFDFNNILTKTIFSLKPNLAAKFKLIHTCLDKTSTYQGISKEYKLL